MSTGLFKIKVSHDIEDHAWDTFLEKNPAGQYEQTSLWAQVKALYNWEPIRIVVYEEGKIVSGIQILIRKMPLIGAVGYVSKGPVFAHYKRNLVQIVINQLKSVTKKFRIQYLIVNPPDKSQNLESEMIQVGFEKGSIVDVTAATLIIDLSIDLDDILVQVKKRTREYIRYGQKRGVIVREGNREEITLFYQLMLSTCSRQKVSPSPSTEEFFQEMWRLFYPHDYVRLFIAEVNGEILASAFVVTFGNTVRVWKVGWSGNHANRRPNHVLWWEIIKWAKRNRYRYFDFVGIDPAVAHAVLRKCSLPESSKHSPSFFKLRFGGKVAVLPGAYSYIYNPIFRWGYHSIFPRIKEWPLTQKILKNIN